MSGGGQKQKYSSLRLPVPPPKSEKIVKRKKSQLWPMGLEMRKKNRPDQEILGVASLSGIKALLCGPIR